MEGMKSIAGGFFDEEAAVSALEVRVSHYGMACAACVVSMGQGGIQSWTRYHLLLG